MSGYPCTERYTMYPLDTICVGAFFDTNRTISVMEDWFDRAKIRMKAVGVTQEDLMPLFKVTTRGAVGHYLSGRRDPSTKTMVALADKLDVSLDLLLRGAVRGSQLSRPDPEILGSAVELGRKAFLELDDDTFDPETHGDVVAEAYVFLASRRQHKATPSNVIDFAKALKRLGVRDGNERTGSPGGGNSKKSEAGGAEEAKVKRGWKNG